MPRLFTAVPLPSHLADALSRCQQPLPGARWLEPADYHLTLRFAGDIDNRTAREFADALSRVDVDPFEMRLDGFGVFGAKDPRTLWAGVAAGPALAALQRANESAARAAGLKPERQHFKPHVTVARLRHAAPDPVANFLQRNASMKSPGFLVDHFGLYSSKPKSGGGPYVLEEKFPLAGSYWLDESEADDAGDQSAWRSHDRA